tara:strand:- start:1696 stop:2115 length:420 start_codon:yes stop_codon:yes gene_type:complete
MARMYSHETVMKLLETQRKSIMEFEAAKYELLLSGLIEKSDIDETRVALEAEELSEEEPDIDKFMVALEAVEDWSEEVIHDMVCKIKTYVVGLDAEGWSLWEDWVLHTLGFYKHHQQAKRKYGKSTLVNRILHIEPLNK